MRLPTSQSVNDASQNLFEVLKAIYPVDGLICIGSVDLGLFQTMEALATDRALFIENSEKQLTSLQQRGYLKNQSTAVAKLADRASTQPFHSYSLPAVNGATTPVEAKKVWPNINLESTEDANYTTLDEFLEDRGESGGTYNWLMVNCTDASAILNGSAGTLVGIDVLVTLQTRGTQSKPATNLAASLDEKRFTQTAVLPARHPNLTIQVFTKDWKTQSEVEQQRLTTKYDHKLNELTTSLDEKSDRLKQAHQQIEKLNREVQEQTLLATQSQDQINAMSLETDEKNKQLENSQNQINTLTKNLSEQKQLAEDRDSKIDQLTKAHDELKGKLSHQPHVNDSGLAPIFPANSAFEEKLIFKTPVQLGLEKKTNSELAFFSMQSEILRVEEGRLFYDFPEGQAHYLVSSESGEFGKPPKVNQLQLTQDTLYLFKGSLTSEGTSEPIFWLFEYDETTKLDSISTPCRAGGFETSFHTRNKPSTYGLGIRLAGKGSIDLETITIKLTCGLEVKVSQQEKQIAQLHSGFERYKLQTTKNILKQVENFARIQHYLGTEINVPPMHGWPISPDFGMLMIQLIEESHYDALIEFGSGTSTLLIAKALQKQATRLGEYKTSFLSFDHLDQYFQSTRKNLERSNLATLVDLQMAPLSPYIDADGDQYRYYDCTNALNALASTLPQNPSLLVVVDGPPAATGHHARYPALPVLLEQFQSSRIDILMDDFIRDEEQKIVNRWQRLLEERGFSIEITEFRDLEKQACLVSVNTIKRGTR